MACFLLYISVFVYIDLFNGGNNCMNKYSCYLHFANKQIEAWKGPGTCHWNSLVAQTVKNLLAVQETQVQSPEEGNGYPLQYSCLENFMEEFHGGAW